MNEADATTSDDDLCPVTVIVSTLPVKCDVQVIFENKYIVEMSVNVNQLEPTNLSPLDYERYLTPTRTKRMSVTTYNMARFLTEIDPTLHV